MTMTNDAPWITEPVRLEAVAPAPDDPIRARLGWLGRKLPSTNDEVQLRAFIDVARRVSVLRSLYYSLKYRGRFLVARGTKVLVKRSATIVFDPGAWLFVGFRHHSSAPALIDLGRDARLVLHGTTQVWRGAQLTVLRGGCLELGDRGIFGEGSRVVCCKHVRFGDGSGLSWNATVLDTDLHPIKLAGRWREQEEPVVIGDHVMVCAGATVLKGVTIGDGCIIGAAAVVRKDVPPRSLVAGNPGRVVAHDVDWR